MTLKSFPFELRGWEVEKFKSIDPTDGFGSTTRIYISKNQVVQIEPEYNSSTFNTWVTDKSRQFYDGAFNKSMSNVYDLRARDSEDWYRFIISLSKFLYLLKNNNKQMIKSNFFTIVFEYISLEVLGLLLTLSQNFSFFKIKKAQNSNLNNDLESNFQLNLISNKSKLSLSTFSLLVSSNLRYEGSQLNLSLRQKFLKGDFKCLLIGSLINLTFPTKFLGSNLKTLENIFEGNQLLCQNITFSRNPLLIFNDEILKRNDSKNLLKLLKVARHLNVFNNACNRMNFLNSSLNSTGNLLMSTFLPLNFSDFVNFSSIHFLNFSTSNNSSFKKVTEIKLFKSVLFNNYKTLNFVKLIADQTPIECRNHLRFYKALNPKNKNIFKSMLTTIFYENSETFINTEGYSKQTKSLLELKKTRSSWQLLRRMIKQLKKNIIFIADKKSNQTLFFDTEKMSSFMNFVSFQYFVAKALSDLNFYLFTKTNSFILINKYQRFKFQVLKVNSTKLKYWLDDFYIGGKDEYTHNSFSMVNCSKVLRLQTTNFF